MVKIFHSRKNQPSEHKTTDKASSKKGLGGRIYGRTASKLLRKVGEAIKTIPARNRTSRKEALKTTEGTLKTEQMTTALTSMQPLSSPTKIVIGGEPFSLPQNDADEIRPVFHQGPVIAPSLK